MDENLENSIGNMGMDIENPPDNDPKHNAKLVKKFFTDNDKLLKLLDFPPCSPEMNPIENLWAALKIKVNKRKPTNIKQLWEYTEEEWKKFDNNPNNMLGTLAHSISDRLYEVILANGYATDY